MALAERLRISPGVPLLLAAFVWLASPLLLGVSCRRRCAMSWATGWCCEG